MRGRFDWDQPARWSSSAMIRADLASALLADRIIREWEIL
jgi:hypothetical protein